jgi:hypothetical protein
MRSRAIRGAVAAAAVAAAGVLVAAGAALAHPGGKLVTPSGAASLLTAHGVSWADAYSNTVVSARCDGEGKATRRGSRKLYAHFTCAVTTKETLPYRLRLHSIGTKDQLYAIDFLRWSSYGSRTRPVPVGTAAPVGDGWTVKVLSVNADAAPAVLDYQKALTDDDEKVTLAPGNRLVLARISATRTAPVPGALDDWLLHVVGASNVVSRHEGCGEFPDEIRSDRLFPGGSIEGNVCWQVPAADIGSLVLFEEYAPPYSFFSLAP